MKDVKLLEKIGLTSREASVYKKLLEIGPSVVTVIARNADMHRPVVYDVLPELESKGLVTRIPKGKRMLYAAEPPEKLELLYKNLKGHLDKVIPQLKGIQNTSESKPIVKFLEGEKGMVFILDDMLTTLKKGDVYYRYSPVGSIDLLEKYLPQGYRERRDSKQLERFVITNERLLPKAEEKLERVAKAVPKEFDVFEQGVMQIIYADKVAFIDYNSETALLIENPSIADFQKKIFKLLFKLLS